MVAANKVYGQSFDGRTMRGFFESAASRAFERLVEELGAADQDTGQNTGPDTFGLTLSPYHETGLVTRIRMYMDAGKAEHGLFTALAALNSGDIGHEDYTDILRLVAEGIAHASHTNKAAGHAWKMAFSGYMCFSDMIGYDTMGQTPHRQSPATDILSMIRGIEEDIRQTASRHETQAALDPLGSTRISPVIEDSVIDDFMRFIESVTLSESAANVPRMASGLDTLLDALLPKPKPGGTVLE